MRDTWFNNFWKYNFRSWEAYYINRMENVLPSSRKKIIYSLSIRERLKRRKIEDEHRISF